MSKLSQENDGRRSSGAEQIDTRLEKDSLGERQVPIDAYYGIQTMRGSENFRITGLRLHPELVRALAMVKKATALSNAEVGRMPHDMASAIAEAADEVISGKFDDQFILDPIQGGAGTSMNMNINEVLANRAIEILGGRKGDYTVVNPLNHVNMGQSTNDVVPTAARVALLGMLETTVKALDQLATAFEKKSCEFRDVVKMGRTHLQDAVPITSGQEFGAWAKVVRRDIKRIEQAREDLLVINLGGTAVGTGLNTDVRYIRLVCDGLSEICGYSLKTADDLVDCTQNTDVFASLSSCLKVCSINLCKIANDMRLLASGPMAGFYELVLPAMQPGSSIMPAKVNPVIPEVVNQVAFQIMGNDLTVSMVCQAGQLELNVFMPVMLLNLLQSVEILGNAAKTLAERCVEGITVNRDRCHTMVETNVGIVTALVPYIGYQTSCDIAKEARRTGRTVRSIVLERGLLSEEKLDYVLSFSHLTCPIGMDDAGSDVADGGCECGASAHSHAGR